MSSIFRAFVSISKTIVDVNFEIVFVAVVNELLNIGLVEGVNEVIGLKEIGKGSLCFFSSSKGRDFKTIYLPEVYIKNRVQ